MLSNGASSDSLVADWAATGIVSDGALSSLNADTRITAAFDADGRVSGSAGCNRYTAAYSVDEPSIEISSAAVTRMFCSSPGGVMEQEDRYLLLLSQAATFEIAGTALELYGAEGDLLVSYERVVA